MQIAKAIRKVSAVSAGAVMLGATITGAMAASLSDYPEPFVKNGKYDMLPVYGDTSTGDDIAGAWDILGGLAAGAVSSSGTSGSSLIVSGGESDEIPINSTVTAAGFMDSQLDDEDINSFQDSSLSFRGGSYDFHDELDIGSINGTFGLTPANGGDSAPIIATSLTSGDDDYESNVYMNIPSKAISYFFVFDEKIKLNDTSTTYPLKMNFLGKTFKIIEVSANNEFTAYVGDEYFMNVGDSVVADGKTITLTNVGQSAIVVDVDGVSETISSTNTETVNGVEITVDELFYRTQVDQSSATLIVGKDSSEKVKDDDYYFGGDENCLNNDPNDADCWRWNVGQLYFDSAGDIYDSTNNGPTIGIESRFVINDDKDNPPTIGDCVNLPNNYASVCMDSLNVADTDYVTYEVSYESSADLSNAAAGLSSARTIKIESQQGLEEGLLIDATDVGVNKPGITTDTKTDTVYLYINGSAAADQNDIVQLFYEDTNNKVQYAGNVSFNTDFLNINYEDTKGTDVEFMLLNTSQFQMNMTVDITGREGAINDDDLNITLAYTSAGGFSGTGKTISVSEADELTWSSAPTQLGKKDEDHRTMYGIILRDPESNLDADSVVMDVPKDQVEANVVVKGQSTKIVSSTGGAVADTAPPMVKASEVSNPSADNLLVVGGPAVNSLAAQFVGSTWTYKPGEAIVELKANGAKVAMVVAGTDAIDTRRACRILRDYKMHQDKLVGSAVKVTGTSSTFTDTVIEAKA